jgi:DUF1680 family protein
MAPVRIFAHPAVAADTGRVALARGPLVYCLEEPDNAGGPVQDLQLPPLALLAAEPRDGTLGRHVAVTASGTRLACPPDHPLYSPLRAPARSATLTAIPYYLWGNREPGSMQVWIREPAG